MPVLIDRYRPAVLFYYNPVRLWITLDPQNDLRGSIRAFKANGGCTYISKHR